MTDYTMSSLGKALLEACKRFYQERDYDEERNKQKKQILDSETQVSGAEALLQTVSGLEEASSDNGSSEI